jgi:molybdate transport system substrate-binding protein
MKLKCRVALVLLLAVLSSYGVQNTAAESELIVHAASSLTDVLTVLSKQYERSTGQKVTCNFGASSTLARQIQEGAPGDIFFSADEAKIDQLQSHGLIVKEFRKSLLSNTLVIVVAKRSSVQLNTTADLLNTNEKIAIAEPQSVPAGIYAKKYLQKIHAWEKIVHRLVYTDNVRAALSAVESGNVEMAIVYRTDAQISKKVRIAFEVPRKEGPRIGYPIALLTQASQRVEARKLYEFLVSDPALRIYQQYDFLISSTASP